MVASPLQHVELGWHVLQWNMHQQFMDTKALAWGWTNPLYRVDVEAFVGVVRKLMEGPKLGFLPLGSHGHWTLLVVDRRHEPAVLRCCCKS